MKTIQGQSITGRDYIALLRREERRIEEMQADVTFLSCLLIFMAALALYLACDRPLPTAYESRPTPASEAKISKKDLAIIKAHPETYRLVKG